VSTSHYSHFFIFDVESIGLYGLGFTAGWVLVDRAGHILEEQWHAFDPRPYYRMHCERDCQWVDQHVWPHLDGLASLCDSPTELYAHFWEAWMRASKRLGQRVVLTADRPFPVETSFLDQVVRHALRQKAYLALSPSMLLDIASVQVALDVDPDIPTPWPSRLKRHHPLDDARMGAQKLLRALERRH